MTDSLASTYTNPTPDSVYQAIVKVRFTKSLDSSGWLRIKMEPSGESRVLCECVKVTITKEGDRTEFLVMEGSLKGKVASLGAANAAKCLVAVKRGSGASIVARIEGRKWWKSKPRNDEGYNQLSAKLMFNGQKATITLDSDVDFKESNPLSPNVGRVLHSKALPKGTYKIMVPEVPKDANMTAFYVTRPGGYPDLKYHTVWFPIEYAATQNSNFIHVGNLSEGCVTVYELKMWNPLYQYLITNRVDKDGKYVGTITIE